MEIKNIFIHHSASLRSGNSKQLSAINNYHYQKDWGNKTGIVRCKASSLGYYVQYHYLIEPSGEIIQTAKENEIRWHAGDYNATSLGICLTGNFDVETPTGEQERQLRALLLELVKRYPNAKIRYHREVAPKSCPGNLIPDDWAINLIKNKTMSNVKLVKNGNEYGFFVPASNEVSLIDKGMNFGMDIPTAGENKVDWAKLETMCQGELTIKK